MDSIINNELTQLTDDKVSKLVIFIGVLIGLFMNWLALYLNVVLGLLSVGISAFVVLLLIKLMLRSKATQKNLSIVSVSYGATSAAEASVGLLFLLWLFKNASTFGFTWDAPSWLLPSAETINNGIILSAEWIVPLIVHYFLMFIPGITGLILGVYLAPKFINNEKDYPFPGTIQRVKAVEVLVTNKKATVNLFVRFLILGFIIAFITLFFQAIDLSNVNDGFIIGIMLGTVGVTMFAVGFIVNNPKITVPAGISSVVMYTLLSPFVMDFTDYQNQVSLGTVTNDFFGLYSYLLQNTYLSFLIGFILTAILLTPIVWKFGKKFYRKIRKQSQEEKFYPDTSQNPASVSIEKLDEDSLAIKEKEKQRGFSIIDILSRKIITLILVYLLALLLSVWFVVQFNIIPETSVIIIVLLMVWILFLGSLIQGYITVSTLAKSSTSISPPFIFDSIPLFLIGARGLTPYIATPKGEIRETMDIVSTLKFGQQMQLSQRTVLGAYLAGYFSAALTTPIFTLFLWKALGIGTVNFPAPGFPIFLAMIGPFAAGAIEMFLNIGEVIIGALLALLFPEIGISVAIGMFFPPHMALALMFGGISAWLVEKKKGKEWINDQGRTIGTALSVGATFTVPLLILLNILL
ncbi:MAG: OPT/YSL family transporter [Candidatus Hodarchaeales archaeon]|jgi:hypothetical protein